MYNLTALELTAEPSKGIPQPPKTEADENKTSWNRRAKAAIATISTVWLGTSVAAFMLAGAGGTGTRQGHGGPAGLSSFFTTSFFAYGHFLRDCFAKLKSNKFLKQLPPVPLLRLPPLPIHNAIGNK
jgi:hypothetical protein